MSSTVPECHIGAPAVIGSVLSGIINLSCIWLRFHQNFATYMVFRGQGDTYEF